MYAWAKESIIGSDNGNNPILEPMQIYCQLYKLQWNLIKISTFLMIRKYSLYNNGHIAQVSIFRYI